LGYACDCNQGEDAPARDCDNLDPRLCGLCVAVDCWLRFTGRPKGLIHKTGLRRHPYVLEVRRVRSNPPTSVPRIGDLFALPLMRVRLVPGMARGHDPTQCKSRHDYSLPMGPNHYGSPVLAPFNHVGACNLRAAMPRSSGPSWRSF
jgi:hypothetical protein